MFPGLSKVLCGILFSSPIGQRHWDYYAALARMLEAQQGTQTADADENGAPVDTGAELNADAQDTVRTEDGGAPVETAPAVDDVPETVEESVTGEVPQTEAGEQAA